MKSSVDLKEDVVGMANSVDPDNTPILEAVWSGSILFTGVCT